MRLFESARQAPLFVLFFCAGVIAGAVYDVFYIFRCGKKNAAIYLSDILFSFCFFAVFAFFAYFFNSGEIHWYFFPAVFLGFCAERASLGFFIKKLIDFITKIVYNLVEKSNIKPKLERLKK